MTELRSLIRELLAEELARVKRDEPGSAAREESVSINNDSDLAAFARRVLQIAAQPSGAEDIRQGRVVFRLQSNSGRAEAAGSPTVNGTTEALEKTLITERDVNSLPESATMVSIDGQSRLTPLAKDELRRRGIKLLRKSP